MNKQKGSANVVLIILVIVLAVAASYFAFVKKPTDTKSVTPQSNKTATPTIASSTHAGWNTYRNTQYSFSFEYPSDLKISFAGPEGNRPFVVRLNDYNGDNDSTARTVDVEYVTDETLHSFVSEAWGHDVSDKHTDMTVNGNQVATYDLVETIHGRGEGSVVGYSRFVQAGIQSPKGKFLNVVVQTGFADKTSAQNADESWAKSIISSVQL